MLKKQSIRRIIVTTAAILVIGLIYFFPTLKEDVKIDSSIRYVEEESLSAVYLLDKYSYVSKINVDVTEEDVIELAKEKLEYLTHNSTKSDKLPNGFKALIPADTKVLDIKLEEGVLTVDFSKEILGIRSEEEERMVEAIVFTLTSIDGISSIIIKVEGKVLERLPNSNKLLPNPLNRDYGINKIYDFYSLHGLTKTTIYYLNEMNDVHYYTPVTKVTNDAKEKISIIIDELKSSVVYQSNLSSYLNGAAELKDYKIIEQTMYLTFNDKILDGITNNNILEEVKYSISLSIKDNYNVEEVVFNVDDKEITKTVLKELN